jgi:hypothetical protein
LTLESSQFYFFSLSHDTGILSEHYEDSNPIISIVNSVVCILSLCQTIWINLHTVTQVFTFHFSDSYNKFEDIKVITRGPTKEGQTMIYKTQHRKLKIVQRRKLWCHNTSCCSTWQVYELYFCYKLLFYLTSIWVVFLLQVAVLLYMYMSCFFATSCLRLLWWHN